MASDSERAAAVETAGWQSGYTLEVLDHFENWEEFGADAAPGNRVGALKHVSRDVWAAQPREAHHPANTDWFRYHMINEYLVESQRRNGGYNAGAQQGFNAREQRETDCTRYSFDGRVHLGIPCSLGCVEWTNDEDEGGCVVYMGQGHMNQTRNGAGVYEEYEEYYSTYKVLPDWIVTDVEVDVEKKTLSVYRADARPLAEARQVGDVNLADKKVGSYRTVGDSRDADVLQAFFDCVMNPELAPVSLMNIVCIEHCRCSLN